MRAVLKTKNIKHSINSKEIINLMGRIALDASNINKKRMRPPKSGRKYKKYSKGKKGGVLRVHTASAPGEYLSTDTGRTRNSTLPKSHRQGSKYFAILGTSTRYPAYWHGPDVKKDRYREFVREALIESIEKHTSEFKPEIVIKIKK